MHAPSLAATMTCIYRDDWLAVGDDILLASAGKPTAIGADFLICLGRFRQS